jgi:hypothetical protein
MVLVAAFSIALVYCPLAGATERPTEMYDGRGNTKCFPARARDGSKSRVEYCDVSMLRLSARPEEYHGRYISTIGFLVINANDEPALFPSEELANAAHRVGGLTFEPSLEGWLPKSELARLKTGLPRIRVSGRFDAYSADSPFGVGVLVEVWGIGPALGGFKRHRQ